MLNRRVDVDLGSIPAEEDEAKLVIVLGDQERREPVYLGDVSSSPSSSSSSS